MMPIKNNLRIEQVGDKYQVIECIHGGDLMQVVRLEGTQQECQRYISSM